MARRLDFGDQFPSDSGDVPPSSKTLGMEERAYTIPPADTPTPVRPGVIRQAGPDLEQKPVAPLGRVVFTAIVVERVNDTDYWCLRQDGKRGVASYLSPNPGIYDELRLGTEVAIIEDQIPGKWHIISGMRRRQMYSMRLSNAADITANNETIVPMAIGMVTGNDANGVNAELNLKGPALYVTPLGDGEAIYEISFNVTVEYDDTTSSGGSMVIETGCTVDSGDLVVDGILSQSRRTPDVVYLDPTLGFRQEYGSKDAPDGGTEEYSLVTMALTPSNPGEVGSGHVLNIMGYENDPGNEGRARWTKDPRMHSATLETVLRIEQSSGAFGLAHETYSAPQYLITPVRPHTSNGVSSDIFAEQGFNKHLYVAHSGRVKTNSTDADAPTDTPVALLGWTKSGATGTIYYKDASGTTRSFSVDKGIIYEGYGLTQDGPSLGAYNNYIDNARDFPNIYEC